VNSVVDNMMVVVALAALTVVAAYVVMVVLIITSQRRRREDKALIKLLGDTSAETLLTRLKELLDEQRTLSHEVSDTIEQKIIEMRRLIKDAGRIQKRISPQGTAETSAQSAAEPIPREEPTSRSELENLLGTLEPAVPLGPTLRELTAEDKRRRVYACADTGMSVNQIARETNIGKGEVKLILSLRRGR